jgi:hypothetical protein
MKLSIVIGMLALAGAAATATGAATFDPRAHRDFVGPATEVLVLGTPHLAGLPARFTADSLGPLLDRLAVWKPGIITIENLSGSDCDLLQRYKARYADAFDTYCWDLAPAEKATGLNVVAATAEAERLLAHWPATPTPTARRRLAAVFVAAGDRASALVQWLRLAPAERHAGDGIDATLLAILAKGEASRNESYALAAVLAARLGLERVYPVDDHSADAAVADLGKPYEDALARIWTGASGRIAAIKTEEAKLGTPQATLDYYRYENRPEVAAEAFASDFGAALTDPTPELYGRRYVGWWETRNLRMVGNIRAAVTPHPGARVLVVVGASHKGYFEAYLAMMHDIRLNDVEAVLK